MTIYVSPDTQRDNSRWPSDIPVTVCEELETVTGADFVISQFPIDPVSGLSWHIENGSPYVQVKFGWDATSYNNMKRAIARMKESGLRQSQCILLPVGKFEDDLMLKVDEYSADFNTSLYDNLRMAWLMWEKRGGIVEPPLPDTSYIAKWIDWQFKAMENAKEDRIIYPDIAIMTEQESDFQQVIEVKPDDLRSLLCRGLPNFGPEKAKAVIEALKEYGLPETLYYAYRLLTLSNEKNKQHYKVSGIGSKTFRKYRKLFGLQEKQNLSVTMLQKPDLDYMLGEYQQGWYDCIAQIKTIASERQEAGKSMSFAKILELANKAAGEFLLDFTED